jgi:putative transcriptional regulator
LKRTDRKVSLAIMTDHHLSGGLVASYSSGQVSDGVSLAVSAHLTFCPVCRARVAAHEAIGGSLLLAEADTETGAGTCTFDAISSQLDEVEKTEAAPRSLKAGPLPGSVAAAVGCDFDEIPWRFRLPGVSSYEFQSHDGETVSLLKVRPGVRIPQHTHTAEELTVVFSGELVDGDVRYGKGDISIADASVHHHPRAGGDETCICLAVVNGGLRFTGPIGRALNLFS